MALKLPPKMKGYARGYYICLDCGQPQYHEYIPFGIGRGIQANTCWCQITSNRTHRLKTVTRREWERRYRIWYNKHRRKYENKQTD
jgi:hypothetical protein